MHLQMYSMWYVGLMIDRLSFCSRKIEDERFSFTEMTGEGLMCNRELVSPNEYKSFTRNYLSLELCDLLQSQFTINSEKEKELKMVWGLIFKLRK